MATRSAGDQGYDAWHQAIGSEVTNRDVWHRMVCKALEDQRDVEGKNVLEIGCGRGGFACWLATHMGRPTRFLAMDFSEAAVEKARDLAQTAGIHGIEFRSGDIQAIDSPDGSYDTVISCETVEHVPDPRKAIQEMARVLKQGGRLFLTHPNYLSTFGLYRAYLRMTGRRFQEVGQPINQFTNIPQTAMWLRQSGLALETVQGEGQYVFAPGRSPFRSAWLDALAPSALGLHALFVAVKS